MCDPATAGLLITSAIGTGAGVVSNQDALRRQDREAAAGLMRNSEIQRRAGARVNQEIQSVAASNPDAERKAANDDFIAALTRAKAANGGGSIADVGGASSRYVADAGDARVAADATNKRLAGNYAAVDAPQFQRLRESQGAASTASDLGLLQSEASGNDYLTQLRVANERANPWVTGIGQGLSSFGTAYAGRAKKIPGLTTTPRPGPSTGP